MPYSVSEQYHATVIGITGKFLGSLEGEAFKATLNELKEAGRKHVIIDLSKADFMDSSGIGVLIAGLTSMRKADGDMCLAGMDKRIKNLFVMTRLLGSVFESYDTVEDAAQSFNA